METRPIPVVEDATVLPTNPHQERQKHSLEGQSVSILVEEQALHSTDQGLKCRCTSRQTETFAYLYAFGYTSDKFGELFERQPYA